MENYMVKSVWYSGLIYAFIAPQKVSTILLNGWRNDFDNTYSAKKRQKDKKYSLVSNSIK